MKICPLNIKSVGLNTGHGVVDIIIQSQ